MKSASGLAASGLVWSTFSQAVRIICQVLGVVFLTRLLHASDFGVVAMASAVTGFTLLFRDFGTTAAVIQRPVLTPRLLDSVFWFNIGLGLCLASALALLSPAAVWFFSEPRLYEVIWLLALAFPLDASGRVHQALLERVSDFRPIAQIESLAALLGLGSAVWSAWWGWGVFSLVTQTLVSAAVTAAGLWIMSSWRPGRRGACAELKGLWAFSGNLVGFNVLNYLARSADSILIGRFLGAIDLGYYNIAYRVMLWPLQNFSGVVGRALFPVFSRMQADPERLAAAYLRVTTAIVLLSAPLMLGLFVLRDPFVITVLGDQWMPVADLLAWLAPIGLLQSLGTTVGTLYLATGRTDLLFRWSIFACSTIVLAFFVGIQWGLKGLVIGYFVANVILFLPSLMIALKLVNLKVSGVLHNLKPSLLAALAMALLVAFTDRTWGGFAGFPIIRFGVLVALGILSYGLLSYFFQRRLLLDLVLTLRRR